MKPADSTPTPLTDALKKQWRSNGNVMPLFNGLAHMERELAQREGLRPLIAKVRKIEADIADFDGDRRGMYDALEKAERELLDAALSALPTGEPL